jgi:hypothetical protein
MGYNSLLLATQRCIKRNRPAIHRKIHTTKNICKYYFQKRFFIHKYYRTTTGNDDVPGDVLTLLGQNGLKLKTQWINTYETGEWPKDFTEVMTTAFKKNPKASKCSNHRLYSKDTSEDI